MKIFLERRWFWIGLIVFLGLIHSALSYASISKKNPTFDEPIHALGGYAIRFLNDYRIDPEDPALWHRIHALAADRDEATINQQSLVWNKLTADSSLEFLMAHQTYFESGTVDVDSLINRRRALLSIFGAITVIGSGLLARTLAGVIKLPKEPAGIFTSALLAFDPTLLAHSSIIKNDVMITVLMLGMIASLWSIGRRVTWSNALGLITCLALAPVVKFSGVFLAPLAAIVLFIRALMAKPLPVGNRNLTTRFGRLGATSILLILSAIAGYFALWASYGFQLTVTHDQSPFNFARLIDFAKAKVYRDTYGVLPPWNDLSLLPIDFATRVIVFALDHRLAPQAWLYGLLHVHVLTGDRYCYIFGQIQRSGFWYYFPVAFLLKTPLAMNALFLGTLSLFVLRFHRLKSQFDTLWMAISIGIPAALILIISMQSGLNIGIRHILPLWPAIFISTGLFAAWLWTRRQFLARFLAVGMACLSILESCRAAPNYIPFFNLLCGDSVDRVQLLVDSNLDWGQDLRALGEWRKLNPHVPLYLSYFGTADPRYYGIEFINIDPRYIFIEDTVEPDPDIPGVIAYSATNLTSIYSLDRIEYFRSVRARKPIEIIGGTIFLYKWPFDMPDDEWEARTRVTLDDNGR